MALTPCCAASSLLLSMPAGSFFACARMSSRLFRAVSILGKDPDRSDQALTSSSFLALAAAMTSLALAGISPAAARAPL